MPHAVHSRRRFIRIVPAFAGLALVLVAFALGNGVGRGAGWGADARPVGVYVIVNGDVRWRPAVDVNRVVLGGQIAFVVGLLVLRSIVLSFRRR